MSVGLAMQCVGCDAFHQLHNEDWIQLEGKFVRSNETNWIICDICLKVKEAQQ